MIVGDGAGFGLAQKRIATLPIKYGGLGIHNMEDTGKYCYLASCAQTKHLQDSILQYTPPTDLSPRYEHALHTFTQACGLSTSNFSINDTAPRHMESLAVLYFGAIKENLPTSLALNERESIMWHCNRKAHAMDFLKVVPISGLNQTVGSKQFSFVLKYRLGIPFFIEGSKCSICNMPMEIYADHAFHCASEVGLTFRHDMCYKDGVAAIKEVSLGFLSNNSSGLKPADILVYNREDGKDVCFDVTSVSTFKSARTRRFTPSQAINAAITRKHNKYLDQCVTHGYGFNVLAFSTVGEVGEDTILFLKRLRNFLASHNGNHRIGGSLFHILGIIIQKGVGAQLVARLPSSDM